MTESHGTWVCFAVKEEASHFRSRVLGRPDIRILQTGVGRLNAESTLTTALAQQRPDLLITAGFAGGLKPGLARNDIVFWADDNSEWRPRLTAAGARYVRFHCAEQIVTTAIEKQALLTATGCEAVEMESQVIHALCAIHQIPAVTVRVILDTASKDLPLDFNQLMDSQQKIDGRKLAGLLLRSPWKIGSLLRLQRQSARAAWLLGEFLLKIFSV
jgi:adenosylhomocysteine nucleosidase